MEGSFVVTPSRRDLRARYRAPDPRNKAWAEDDSKYGKRLMRSMGWEDGQGLGKHNTGITAHVKAERKVDRQGVGGAKEAAENPDWLANSAAFDSLLASLNAKFANGVPPPSSAQGPEEKRKGKAGKKDASSSSKPEHTSRRSSAGQGSRDGGMLGEKVVPSGVLAARYKRRMVGKEMSNYSSCDMRAILGGTSTERAAKDGAYDASMVIGVGTVESDGTGHAGGSGIGMVATEASAAWVSNVPDHVSAYRESLPPAPMGFVRASDVGVGFERVWGSDVEEAVEQVRPSKAGKRSRRHLARESLEGAAEPNGADDRIQQKMQEKKLRKKEKGKAKMEKKKKRKAKEEKRAAKEREAAAVLEEQAIAMRKKKKKKKKKKKRRKKSAE